MKCFCRAIFIGISLALFSIMAQSSAADTGAPPLPGHPSPVIVGDVFQFVEGSWAEYEIYDKDDESTVIFRMSVLDTEQVRRTWLSRRRTYRWIEFEVTVPDESHVIIKYLARETSEGPGDPHEMIIQIEGFDNPIRVGRRFLAEDAEEFVAADFEWTRQQVDEETITHAGRTFSAWRVQAEAEDGSIVEAIVSEDLPPLGLFFTETPELRMSLLDWGMDASSQITGEPLGITRWIGRQVRDAMRGE